jgi:transposase InsO family protein
MAMKRGSRWPIAGVDEAGTPAESTPARKGNSSKRYSVAERKRLLAELAQSGESMSRFCARVGVSTATICAWRRAIKQHGEAGLVPRESRRNRDGHTGRVRDADERRLAVEAYQRSEMNIEVFARTWGVSPFTLRNWITRYRREGPKGLETKARGRPRGSRGFSKLPSRVHEEIVRTKTRFPSFGLKKVRDFLRRFQGVEVSTGTVARTLDAHRIERRPKSAPRVRKKPPLPRRFERAHAGDLWQTDITSFLLTRHSTRVYLVAFVDDFSRFIVSFGLSTHQRANLVIEALMDGVARFGKPKEVLSDQGRQYFAWRGKSEFQRVLVREGIRHVVARAHHPETVGKCERLWETIGREFWERVKPQDLSDARERLSHFVAHYNFFRPHQGIGGLVPADRFFGAEDALRKTHEARLSARELEEALEETPRKAAYLFGQIGDEQVSVSGERGKLVVHTSSGLEQHIGLMELGAPQMAQKEASDGHGDERSAERQSDLGGENASSPHGQETPEVSTAEGVSARSERAVGDGLARGAGASAPSVHADPRDVAWEEESRGSVGGARAGAAARVAAQSASSLGDALGSASPAAAATSHEGDDDGREGRGSAHAESEERGTLEAGEGSTGIDPALDADPKAQERAVAVGTNDSGGENASGSSTSEECVK